MADTKPCLPCEAAKAAAAAKVASAGQPSSPPASVPPKFTRGGISLSHPSCTACAAAAGTKPLPVVYFIRNELGQDCGKIVLLPNDTYRLSGPYAVVRMDWAPEAVATGVYFSAPELARRKQLGLE